MKTEFNLSEKIGYVNDYQIVDIDDTNIWSTHPATRQAIFELEDVKEFIRLLKEDLSKYDAVLSNGRTFAIIDKLAGKKLK